MTTNLKEKNGKQTQFHAPYRKKKRPKGEKRTAIQNSKKKEAIKLELREGGRETKRI